MIIVERPASGTKAAPGGPTMKRSSPASASFQSISQWDQAGKLDQLVTLARALDTSLDALVETQEEEVVSHPITDHGVEALRWRIRHSPDLVLLRQRVTGPPPEPSRMRAHPGHEWLVVLSGTLTLLLGERRYRVQTNQSAEFDTMLPHAFGAESGPVDVLLVVDPEARKGHRDDTASTASTRGTNQGE